MGENRRDQGKRFYGGQDHGGLGVGQVKREKMEVREKSCGDYDDPWGATVFT